MAGLGIDFVEVTETEALTWADYPTSGTVFLLHTYSSSFGSVDWNNGDPVGSSMYYTRATIYTFATSSDKSVFITVAPEPIELKPDMETGKNWFLADMPAYDVELQVEYFAESNLFLSKEALADKANIAVTAGELGVQFGDDGKSANTVTEGTAMTVKYNGTKKILGMKVEKKPEPLIVNPVVGQVIGSDGKNYDANATLPDGVTALAKIAYVGSDNGEAAPYNHGLALALSDANDGSTYQWSTEFANVHGYRPTSSSFTSESGLQYNATHNSDTYPAFKAAITYSPAAPTGCSAWFLASGYQWQKMAGPVGGLTNLGFQGWVYYWTSTEYNPGTSAWRFSTGTGDWFSDYKNNDSRVRACLAF
jgi:hypothetical protein